MTTYDELLTYGTPDFAQKILETKKKIYEALLQVNLKSSQAVQVFNIDPNSYDKLVKEGVPPAIALDYLGLKRTCCRMNALSAPVLPGGAFVEIAQEAALIANAATTSKRTLAMGNPLQTIQSGSATESQMAPIPVMKSSTSIYGREAEIPTSPLPLNFADTPGELRIQPPPGTIRIYKAR